MAKMVSKSLNPLQYALSIFYLPISRDHLGEKGSRPILHDWNNFESNLKQARKQPALRSTISTTPTKKGKNFVDENKGNSYSKILTPDNTDFEMPSSKIKESINNPLEAFDIENETLKMSQLRFVLNLQHLNKILKTQNVISLKVLISMFFKMINFVTITLGFQQI